MTKQEAIQATKNGMEVFHPQTKGWMELVVTLTHTGSSTKENRQVVFHGDCSPKKGWAAEYLGER